MIKYDYIKIGGVEGVLKEDNDMLRNLEIDGSIGEIKGGYVDSVLKFVGTEGFDNLFNSGRRIFDIVISVGHGEIFRGVCKVVRIGLNGEEYGFRNGDFDVRVIGDNGVWFDLLKGISLRDLDWGVLDYNVGSIVDGFLANPMEDKYGFGLGKWGKWRNDGGSVNVMVDIDESTFVGFVKFVIENGFKKIGYEVVSDFLNSEYVVGMCMPFSMKVYDEEWLKERFDLEVLVDVFKVSKNVVGVGFVIGNADGNDKNSSTSVYSKILNNAKKESGENLFRDFGRPSYFQLSPLVPPNAGNRNSYECVMDGSYEVYLVNENYTGLASSMILTMEVFVNCPINGIPNGGVSKGVVGINGSLIISLNEGDIVDFNFWINSNVALSLEFKDMRYGIRWNRSVALSRRWQIGGLMPKWYVGDILLGLVHGFNLKFETDEVFKRVFIEPSDEWRDNVGFNEGFYKYWSGEKYEIDDRDILNGKRLISRVSLNKGGEIEKKDMYKERRLGYGNDGTMEGIEDKYKSKCLEGRIVFDVENENKVDSSENPFFAGTYQLYESRIKGATSQFTPVVPFLGNWDYYDGGEEKEAEWEDVPRLLMYGGQRVFTNGYIKGGTVRMNGNNDYALPSLWTVNYNDEDGSDMSVGYSDEFSVKGSVIWGLMKRFYLRSFIREERGDRYKYWIEWGIGNVSFREVYDMVGKRLILKKVEGYDGRDRKFCKSYFEEDVFLSEGDFNKVKGVIVRGIGDVIS